MLFANSPRILEFCHIQLAALNPPGETLAVWRRAVAMPRSSIRRLGVVQRQDTSAVLSRISSGGCWCRHQSSRRAH